MKALPTALFLCLAALPVLADDGAIDQVGGTIALLDDHPGITMVAEEVDAVLDLDAGMLSVDCIFVLRNDGEACTVRMGFPESRSNPGGTRQFQNFASWVDGEYTACVRTDPDSVGTTPYRCWWTKEVAFEAGQTRIVRDRYRAPAGYAIYDEKRDCQTFEYTLETGASWAGTIGTAVIRFHVEGCDPGWEPIHVTPEPFRSNGCECLWRFNDFEPGVSGPRFLAVSWLNPCWRRDDIAERLAAGQAAVFRDSVPPDYPLISRRARIEGRVVVDVCIAPSGKAHRAVVARSANPIIDQAAVAAAERSLYLPPDRDKSTWMLVTYDFDLDSWFKEQCRDVEPRLDLDPPLISEVGVAEGDGEFRYEGALVRGDISLRAYEQVMSLVEPELNEGETVSCVVHYLALDDPFPWLCRDLEIGTCNKDCDDPDKQDGGRTFWFANRDGVYVTAEHGHVLRGAVPCRRPRP